MGNAFLLGQIFGGQRGMVMALGIAVVMNFVSYFFSDKIALAAYRAQPVSREQLPRAYEIVGRLSQKIGIPMPKMYVIPTDSPNAFATGRNPNHASVAVTQGILNLLTDEELEGVLAHELGHVKNRDILISSIAATLAGAITFLARMGMFASMFGGGGGRDDRDCRHADSTCGLSLARIPGGCFRSAFHGESLCARKCIAEAGRVLEAHSNAGYAINSASVHCGAYAGHRFCQPLLDPSTDCQAH